MKIISYDEKMLVEFLDHYEDHREAYKKWTHEQIAETFVKNWRLKNCSKTGFIQGFSLCDNCINPLDCKTTGKCLKK